MFSIRKRLFDEIGGFNESFKPPGFGDEFELGERLRKKHVIHVDPTLLVDHKFQGIMARTRSLYHRSYAWARILARTGRFEKANASSKEAIIGAVDILMLITIPAFVLHPLFIIVPATLFLIQAVLNRQFYTFLRMEKGIGFAIRSVIPTMTWSIAQVLGGMHYLIKHALGIEQLTREGGFKVLGFRASKHPSHVVLFVTARCNARCRHCFYWQEIENASDGRVAGTGELSLAEIREISRNMGHVEMLTITGGEPSLREDLPAIMDAFYRQNGTRHVTIHTNGFLGEPLRAMLTAVLRARPLMEINVSLSIDGLKETHDKTRDIEGSFERAMRTLKALERLKHQFGNLSITVNTVFTRLNQDEIVPLVDHVYSRHDIDGFYIALVRGNPREPALKDVAIEKYRSAIKHLETWKARRGAYGNYALARLRNAVDDLAPRDAIKAFVTGRNAYPCKAGQTVIVISERGDVSPCEMLGFSFGNLRDFDHDIGRILASARAKHIVKAIKGSSCSCTWECAVMNNIVFNWRAFPRVALQVVKNLKSML
ncbi:MAG: radical SAM protein [Candidatus Lokiarchaeota archaeon]|nr:radical SAM protein [Candidatus Lokiarchaeota archaeon]